MVQGQQAQSVLQPCLSGERGGQSVKGDTGPTHRPKAEHGEDITLYTPLGAAPPVFP
jgi:hypothetical protein